MRKKKRELLVGYVKTYLALRMDDVLFRNIITLEYLCCTSKSLEELMACCLKKELKNKIFGKAKFFRAFIWKKEI